MQQRISDAVSYTTDYHFDLVGNRMTMDQKTYEYDEADRIKKVEDLLASRLKLYSWEKTEQAGKEVRDGLNATDPLLEAATYLYDLRGRMNKVEVDDDGNGTPNKTVTYAYNPDGFRVTKSDGSDTRHYVVASHNPTGYAQVLEEHVDGSGLDRSYTIGHTVLAQDDGTDALTFLVDGHNSTMALVTTTCTLDQRFAYDAYGSLLEGTGLTSASAANTSHLYTAEHFDADAQMQYLRARWYDPTNGRFNRLDPFAGNTQDPQSLHNYLYAHANPAMNVDPSGWGLGGIVVGLGLATALVGLGMVLVGHGTGNATLKAYGRTTFFYGVSLAFLPVVAQVVSVKAAVLGFFAVTVAYLWRMLTIRSGAQVGDAGSELAISVGLAYALREYVAKYGIGARIPVPGRIIGRGMRRAEDLSTIADISEFSQSAIALEPGDILFDYDVPDFRRKRHVDIAVSVVGADRQPDLLQVVEADHGSMASYNLQRSYSVPVETAIGTR